jgi:hypothetical protein
MDSIKRWWLRLASVAAAAVVGVLVPAVAWAHSNPGVVAIGDELVRRRAPRGGFGLIGGCCCLLVILLVVLIIVLVNRRRRPQPPPPPGM